jgi:hypothetical protein
LIPGVEDAAGVADSASADADTAEAAATVAE